MASLSRTPLSMVGGWNFRPKDRRKIVTMGHTERRWPWWAMFPRDEHPTHRILRVQSATSLVLGPRRKRGWL